VELAWRLADPRLQALDVVHAYEPILESTVRHVDLFGEAARQFNFEAKLQAQAAVETFLAASDAPGSANIMLREGDARQVILDVAAERNTDLVALGTHGRSGAAHVLLGSVAEAVIRAAGCDVLVARAVGVQFKLP
jgi:nucleotide-binding universal stress UspA family protein